MAELQAQYGGKQEDHTKKEEAERRESEMMNVILTQILTQEARGRLNSIALVKPEKAKMIEQMVVRMAQTGQIHGKLGESELVRLLEQISQTKKTTVKFDRRRVDSDDDD